MTGAIRLRRLRRKDRVAWIGLRNRLWPGAGKTGAADFRYFFGRRGFFCAIAWDGARAVGFIEATIRPFANGCDSRPVPFLEGLWVHPRSRRSGVGRALVRAAEAWARAKGFRELGSDAGIENALSHEAHRSYGFRETSRVVYFRKALR